ncbi:hypothetical protein OSB04_002021 [Centaurea solstitialis]|uniref:Secreted protein n=1 Tax=Centaurea solstitialis TaxID=347529 RepID=A0AA38TS47_9ASTR|nr:hypothetical protein OSB04_002021 [Centaurea solstitialis]
MSFLIFLLDIDLVINARAFFMSFISSSDSSSCTRRTGGRVSDPIASASRVFMMMLIVDLKPQGTWYSFCLIKLMIAYLFKLSRAVCELLEIDSLKARLELELNEPEPSSILISSSGATAYSAPLVAPPLVARRLDIASTLEMMSTSSAELLSET